jgi:hypothetical protein
MQLPSAWLNAPGANAVHASKVAHAIRAASLETGAFRRHP